MELTTREQSLVDNHIIRSYIFSSSGCKRCIETISIDNVNRSYCRTYVKDPMEYDIYFKNYPESQ